MHGRAGRPGPGRGRDLIEDLRRTLAGLAPAPLHTAIVAVSDRTEALFPEEAARLDGMIARRRATFSSGRVAARIALAAAGAPAGPILQHGQAPEPPVGWAVSISHTDDWAVAVAARADHADGLGIDIEAVARMEPSYARFVALRNDDLGERPDPATLTRAFALREAVYKAFAGPGQAALRRIDLRTDHQGALAAYPHPYRPDRLDHRTGSVAGHVIAVCRRKAP